MTTGIAVALYNGARFIKKQMDSLREQTRRADCVVFCDDGSTDETVSLVREYIEKYDLAQTWKLYINEKNLGYARNFYHAIELCGTDLVYLCDQDDIWCADKLEKMTAVMQEHPEMKLLSCKHGIIDADDKQMHSILEKQGKQTNSVNEISVETILRAYRWPGMAMCVRSAFFAEIYPAISEMTAAHDVVLALCAADRDGFYEYDYVGVYHRRHDSNTANEESRVSKLLDLHRKLRDMRVYNEMLTQLTRSPIPLSEQAMQLVRERLELACKRYDAVKNRRLKALRAVYGGDSRRMLRKASLACDIWLICFGKYKTEEKR